SGNHSCRRREFAREGRRPGASGSARDRIHSTRRVTSAGSGTVEVVPLDAALEVVAKIVGGTVQIIEDGDAREAAPISAHSRAVRNVLERESGVLLNTGKPFAEGVGRAVAEKDLDDTVGQHEAENHGDHERYERDATLWKAASESKVAVWVRHSPVVNSNCSGSSSPRLSSHWTVIVNSLPLRVTAPVPSG